MQKMPEIDTSVCTDCNSCIEVCPDVFIRNYETGLIEIKELDFYPESCIRDAINICPVDCISL